MRIISLTVLVALFSANVFSATVESVTCHQCWPWNGKVDIGYVLESSANDPVFDVKFFGKIGEGESFQLTDLKGDGSAGIVLGSGSKRAIWDPSAAYPGAKISDFKIAVAAEEGRARPTILFWTLTPTLSPTPPARTLPPYQSGLTAKSVRSGSEG